LGVHVAKGGLAEKMLDASSFKPPAAAWFSTPDWHYLPIEPRSTLSGLRLE
jgi:hypothetical protein